MSAARLLTRMRAAFDSEIPPRALFEQRCPRELGQAVEEQLTREIMAMPPEQAARALGEAAGRSEHA